MRRIADPGALLRAGLRELELDEALAEPLLIYLAELVKWNKAYNLTGLRDPAEMVTRHLLDSLAVVPSLSRFPIPDSRLLDVGSGAGLPGIVLAIAQPSLRVALLDSNGKKARFLRHAVRTLGLNNVEVIEARAEAHEPALRYDAVISRAFAVLGVFIAATEHLIADGGCWLAMKGRLDDNEIAGLPDHVSSPRIVRLDVPGLREERHLVIANRRAPALP